jgi:hypothetical protein
MSESELTKLCKHAIYEASGARGLGVYGCFEATIGQNVGNERVDFMTMDSEGIFKCYEVKISKADFHSKAKLSFLGHYNYLVMPEKLYKELLKDDVVFAGMLVRGIGVYTVSPENGMATCVRKAKKKNGFLNTQLLMFAMIRSLSAQVQTAKGE